MSLFSSFWIIFWSVLFVHFSSLVWCSTCSQIHPPSLSLVIVLFISGSYILFQKLSLLYVLLAKMFKLILISLNIVGIVILSSMSDGSYIWMFGSVLLVLTHGTSTCTLLLVIALGKITYRGCPKGLPLKRIWVLFCFCCWPSRVLLISNDFRASW